jgi:hypothetical protein
MMKTAAALSTWLSRFGLPVYLAQDVPDGAELPYMTVPLSEPEWNRQGSYYIQVWYRTKSNAQPITKADEIVGEIGEGVRIPFDGGIVVLWPSTPLIQMLVDGDVRSAYINLAINSYHMPGK